MLCADLGGTSSVYSTLTCWPAYPSGTSASILRVILLLPRAAGGPPRRGLYVAGPPIERPDAIFKAARHFSVFTLFGDKPALIRVSRRISSGPPLVGFDTHQG